MTFVRPTAPAPLSFPAVPPEYDAVTLQATLNIFQRADAQNRKRGQPVDMMGDKLILTASDGTRWVVVVATDGTLSTTAA